MKRRATAPQPTAAARAEYLARIHRVVDPIECHVDERLAIEELARVPLGLQRERERVACRWQQES